MFNYWLIWTNKENCLRRLTFSFVYNTNSRKSLPSRCQSIYQLIFPLKNQNPPQAACVRIASSPRDWGIRSSSEQRRDSSRRIFSPWHHKRLAGTHSFPRWDTRKKGTASSSSSAGASFCFAWRHTPGEHKQGRRSPRNLAACLNQREKRTTSPQRRGNSRARLWVSVRERKASLWPREKDRKIQKRVVSRRSDSRYKSKQTSNAYLYSI